MNPLTLFCRTPPVEVHLLLSPMPQTVASALAIATKTLGPAYGGVRPGAAMVVDGVGGEVEGCGRDLHELPVFGLSCTSASYRAKLCASAPPSRLSSFLYSTTTCIRPQIAIQQWPTSQLRTPQSTTTSLRPSRSKSSVMPRSKRSALSLPLLPAASKLKHPQEIRNTLKSLDKQCMHPRTPAARIHILLLTRAVKQISSTLSRVHSIPPSEGSDFHTIPRTNLC
jgi:hypothetical protein